MPSRVTEWLRILAASVVVWLVMLALVSASALAATGDTGADGDFAWTELADGTVSITGYSGPGGAVDIPETLSGGAVSAIAPQAFSGCVSLTSVTIPSGVTSIGAGAFGYCSSLESVTIPSGVTSISEYAFYNCVSIRSVSIPSGVTSIGCSAFSGCMSLTSVAIPSGVTSIGWGAFSSCSALESVTIPSAITSISEYTFHGCTSLKSVTIPSGVAWVGYRAFDLGTRSGYEFDRWYTAPVGGEVFVLSCPTIAEATMWSRWRTAVSATPSGSGGSVSGAGTYTTGSVATVTATPAFGYRFLNWTEAASVVSTQAVFSFAVTGPRTLVANFEVVPVRTTLSLSRSSAYPDYGTAATLTATLKRAGSGTLAGRVVVFERYYNGKWYYVGTVVTNGSGIAARSLHPYGNAKTTYRARFGGVIPYTASVSSSVVVTPRAKITRSNSWTTKYEDRAYSYMGYVYPWHSTSDTNRVKFTMYRRNGDGDYVWKKTVIATHWYDSETRTRWVARVTFPTRGSWRVRAYHASDGRNATGYSTWDYVTVK